MMFKRHVWNIDRADSTFAMQHLAIQSATLYEYHESIKGFPPTPFMYAHMKGTFFDFLKTLAYISHIVSITRRDIYKQSCQTTTMFITLLKDDSKRRTDVNLNPKLEIEIEIFQPFLTDKMQQPAIDERLFDPNLPTYNAVYVYDFFFNPASPHLDIYYEWRRVLGQGVQVDNRCDRCYVFNLHCAMNFNGCGACNIVRVPCTRRYLNFLSNQNLQGQLHSILNPNANPVPAPQPPPNPNINPGLQFQQQPVPNPSTSYPFGPFVNNVPANSTVSNTLAVPSFPVNPNPPPSAPSAYPPAPPVLPPVPSTPSGSATPEPNNQVPRPGRPMYNKYGRVYWCKLCYYKIPKRVRPCNADPENGIGCTHCTNFGLFCVVEGRVLRPLQTPDDKPQTHYSKCAACRRHGRNCDRKRPCDSCVKYGSACHLEADTFGCFYRGVDGDDQPLYYLRLGYGLEGVDSVRPAHILDRVSTPHDYHLHHVPSTSALPHQPAPVTQYELAFPSAPINSAPNPALVNPAPVNPAPYPPLVNPVPFPALPNPAPVNPAPYPPLVNPVPFPALPNPAPVNPAPYPPLVNPVPFPALLNPVPVNPAPNPPLVDPAFIDPALLTRPPVDPAFIDPALLTRPPVQVSAPAGLFGSPVTHASGSPAVSQAAVNPNVALPSIEAVQSPMPGRPAATPGVDSSYGGAPEDRRSSMARYILEDFDGWSPAPPGGGPPQSPAEQQQLPPELQQLPPGVYGEFEGWDSIDNVHRRTGLGGNRTAIPNTGLSSTSGQEVVLARLLDNQNEFGNLGADEHRSYANIFEAAHRMVNEQNQIIDLNGIRDALRADMFLGLPAGDSLACIYTLEFLQERHSAQQQGVHAVVPVNLPSTIDLGSASRLNPGNAPIQNVMLAPPNRPFSPGPLSAIHDHGVEIDRVATNIMNVFPVGHFARPVPGAMVRPQPYHPNANAHPVLQSIPFKRILGSDGTVSDTPNLKCLEYKGNRSPACGKATAAICEDTTHAPTGFPVCDDCERESRQRFAEEMNNMAMPLRSYACEDCCTKLSVMPASFKASGRRIWGFPPEQDNHGSSKVVLKVPPFTTVGGFQGVDPLPVTGCSCATKVFDRRLCSPHRLQHIIRLRQAADELDSFLMMTYGTTRVCPYCQRFPGIDAFGFQGRRGNEGGPQVYFCKACHDVVILRNGKKPPQFSWVEVSAVSPNTALQGIIHNERSPRHPGVPFRGGFVDTFKYSLLPRKQ
ncbi:hypothetical protein K449DRAFT_466913 [Hypoxylon sp. EC38]|nr:hypothetical protein K449DRAFT_466913 [Hypoxylon sp. EC38]